MADRRIEPLPLFGAKAVRLQPFDDTRGRLFEIFRSEWDILPPLRQWNFVRTRANTLRGLHVHLNHDDFVVVLEGRLTLGLHDLRPDSPTCGLSHVQEFDADLPTAVLVPRGVLHGFCFVRETSYLYGLTAGWSPADDLGCLWSDEHAGIAWPAADPTLSERDRNAGSLESLRQLFMSRWDARAAAE
jgi:dTDP-4-dehydrorhamnose 3,5-epimerase